MSPFRSLDSGPGHGPGSSLGIPPHPAKRGGAPQVFRVIQEGSLYGLLFLLPFSTASVEILFGFLLFGWIVARLDPATRAESVWTRRDLRPLALSLGGYLVVCALSITVSDDPSLGLRAWFSKWLEYLLLFVIAADLASRRTVLTRSLAVVACSAVFVVIEGVAQEVIGHGIFRPFVIEHPAAGHGRMSGPYPNPADLATYLMVIMPMLLMWSITHRAVGRRVLWGLLLLLVLCLVRTETLGAWIGLCAGIGFVAWISRRAVVRRAGLVLLATLILVGGIALQRVGHLEETLSLSDIGKIDRWVMWQAAFGMIRDRPLLGHGLNTFMAKYLDYWVGGERQPRYAHNCYLQVWAETGVVGMVLFVALLGLLFARLVAVLRRSRSDSDHLILAGCLAGLVAFAVQAGVDTNFYSLRQAALFWVLSGLALGWSERLAND